MGARPSEYLHVVDFTLVLTPVNQVSRKIWVPVVINSISTINNQQFPETSSGKMWLMVHHCYPLLLKVPKKKEERLPKRNIQGNKHKLWIGMTSHTFTIA